jgi:NodT family efflux transporter outer membrane factor (OMF) lipoprotein
VGPNYHPPSPYAPPAFAEASATAGRVTGANADLSQWWMTFNDPILNGLIVDALADNPDLKTAVSRVREARQEVKEAAASELPTISGSGAGVTVNSDRASDSSSGAGAGSTSSASNAGVTLPSHVNLYSLGFDATWEVDLFGGNRRRIEAAKDTEEAMEWARWDGQVALVAEVVNDYITLRALQARTRIGQDELDRQRNLFGLIRARRQSGFITNLDVDQQSVQVETAAAQLPSLQAEAHARIHALGVLVGRPPEALFERLAPVQSPLPDPPAVLRAGLPSELLRRRPDVREAERRLAASTADVGVQVAKLYPSLNLLGLGSFAATTTTNFFTQQNLQSLAIGSITQPIFNGGASEAAIRAAKEERAQALVAYQKAVLGAFRDVEDAVVRFQAQDRRREALERALSASQNSLRIAESQYKVGTVAFINVIQAENAVLNSQDQLTQAEAQVLSDVVSLYKALGGGYAVPGDTPGGPGVTASASKR